MQDKEPRILSSFNQEGMGGYGGKMYVPQPRTPAVAIALIIAQGTAVAALAASSLMCTLESKPPCPTKTGRKCPIQ